MGDYDCIKVELSDDVATITFNRPEKKNCMSPQLHKEMFDAMPKIRDKKVKALVLTGAGESFCAGMDLEQCFLEPFDKPELMEEINRHGFGWMHEMRHFPGVTIAKVNGWCFGGGMELVGIMDIVLAADESVWGLSEVNFGIFPGGGTTWSYAHNMPRKQALYYALTGETFTGKEGVALGYVTKSAPKAELDALTDKVVANITNKGRAVLAKTKEVYERSIWMDFEESIEWEMAKLWELSRETQDDWIRTALASFSRREFKPGTQSYKLTKDV